MLLIRPLLRYADFQGRARRAEYFLFLVSQGVLFTVCLVMGALSFNGRDAGEVVMGVLSWLAIIGLLVMALMIPNYALLARRLHDIGRSARWMALLLPNVFSQFAVFRSIGHAASAGFNTAQAQTSLSAMEQAALVQGAGVSPTPLSLAQTGSLLDTPTLIIVLIAWACSLALFIMTILPGQTGPNRYGPDPKNPDAQPQTPSGLLGDEDRLEELFAQARRDSRAADSPYKPVFDFGPGPLPEYAPAPAKAPSATGWEATWPQPPTSYGAAPARTFGRRS